MKHFLFHAQAYSFASIPQSTLGTNKLSKLLQLIIASVDVIRLKYLNLAKSYFSAQVISSLQYLIYQSEPYGLTVDQIEFFVKVEP
ncbi:hypothetical protein ACFLY2_02655 [Patescibacteria group bacterium]